MQLRGIVIKGHQVASGAGGDPRYPQGTLGLQFPIFEKLGLDLSALHPATLNVSVPGGTFRPGRPTHYFRQLAWSDHHPPEDFHFFACTIHHAGRHHQGWIYLPDPATKKEHHQDGSVLEVLAPWIDGLAYGDAVLLECADDALERG